MMTESPQPLVSVVIPAYKRPPATLRAVRSALAQTHTNLEVIVVDDASGDGTAEAAASTGDPRVRVMVQERNQGAPAARNRGIMESRGDTIALLDSDDELLPDSIRVRVAALAARPDCSMVYTRVITRYSERLQLVQPPAMPPPDQPLIEILALTKGWNTSALMARAAALRQSLFDPDLPRFQDWDVALKLRRFGPALLLEEPLTVINAQDEGAGRITGGFDPERAHRFIELHREELDASPAAEAAILYRLAMRALRLGRRDPLLRYLNRALALQPRHRKARLIRAACALRLDRALPTLLRLRWRLMLLLKRV